MIQLDRHSLGEICDKVGGIIRTGPFGSQLHESDYKEEGIPVVMPKNIVDGKISIDGIARISEDDVARLAQHKLRKGDIVYGRRGDIGRRALISAKEDGWICGTGCLRISLGNTILDPLFLYYFLGQPKVIEWIFNQAIGATLPNLNTEIIRSIQILYPSLLTQRKIASILSAYDDLIVNNTRRIAILEEMAQSLYREWFVHFRFPGHEKKRMVESALGLIPEGWEIKALEYFGTIVTGKTPSKLVPEYFDEEYMPFVKTPDLHGNMFCIRTEEYLSEQGALSQKNKTIPPNSLCVNCIGARAGSVSITIFRSQTNQQINSIILNEAHFRELLYFVLLGLKETIHQYGSNGATMVNLNKAKFGALSVIYPLSSIIAEFHEMSYPMFEEIKSLQLRNANLRQTRDLLLPKLISGEVDVEWLNIHVEGGI